MAVVKCLQRYRETPNFRDNYTITGKIISTECYPDITPAEFLVVSSSHDELQDIGEWVQCNDIQGVISVSDSVDGINHSLTAKIFEKEAIVLFMLIWA